MEHNPDNCRLIFGNLLQLLVASCTSGYRNHKISGRQESTVFRKVFHSNHVVYYCRSNLVFPNGRMVAAWTPKFGVFKLYFRDRIIGRYFGNFNEYGQILPTYFKLVPCQ